MEKEPLKKADREIAAAMQKHFARLEKMSREEKLEEERLSKEMDEFLFPYPHQSPNKQWASEEDKEE